MQQSVDYLLLADGDRERANRLVRRLSHLGIGIEVVGDGASALLSAHRRRPRLLVCLPDLPILDGYRLVEALRSRPETASIPAVLVTESAGPQELARGWRAGADLCIPLCQGEADVLATLHRLVTNQMMDPVEAAPALV